MKPQTFPVGKVNFMQMDPMTFTEFLLANGDENLAEYLEAADIIEPLPDAFFNPLYEKLKMYYVTGGMPEPVKMWTEARDVDALQWLVDARLAQLAPTAFGEGNRLFTEFKGALTENFVLQTLITQFEVTPRYWTQTNPPYKVDFLIQRENDIFPVEVKSEANTASRSLKKFKELFPDQVKLRVRFSLDNLKLDGDMLNIPLFMADQTDRLIGIALRQKKL